MMIILSLVFGLIFGAGIAISGMANPAKVLNFFDVAGNWDPSLGFVMGGALIVSLIGYQLIFRRGKPLLDAKFYVPTRRDIDGKLILGASIFGIGWGIGGFCPGASIPALGLLKADVVTFVLAMLVGIVIGRFIQNAGARKTGPQSA